MFEEEKKRMEDIQKEIARLEKESMEVFKTKVVTAPQEQQDKLHFELCYKPYYKKIEALKSEALSLKALTIDVGKKISISPYTDWQSYTIVKRTKQTLTCQEDRQTHFKDCWQDGELECERDEKGSLITLRWSKKHGWWSYGIYRVSLGERNYRDPSF